MTIGIGQWHLRITWLDVCVQSDPDLAALVRTVQARGPLARSAFSTLAAAHTPWLLRYLCSLLGGAAKADDACQETLLRAYTSIERLQDAEKFRPWVRRIATRTAFNQRRDASTRGRYEDLAPAPQRRGLADDQLAADDSLHHVLELLPYPYREILVLRYVEDLDLVEIEAVLELGTSATKMRLKRARDAFTQLHGEATRGK